MEGFITLWFCMFPCIIFFNVDMNICFSVYDNIHENVLEIILWCLAGHKIWKLSFIADIHYRSTTSVDRQRSRRGDESLWEKERRMGVLVGARKSLENVLENNVIKQLYICVFLFNRFFFSVAKVLQENVVSCNGKIIYFCPVRQFQVMSI